MRPALAFVLVSIVALACEGAETPEQGQTAEPAASAADDRQSTPEKRAPALLPDELPGRPCELLPPATVAEVARVDPGEVTPRSMSNACTYTWEGGSASLLFVRVDATPEYTRSRFESGPRPASGDAPQLEAVEGVGDRARFETTRFENVIGNTTLVEYANRLDVIVRNLSFSVTFQVAHAAEVEGEDHREQIIALASAIVSGLPR